MQLEDFTSKMHIPKEYIRVDNTNFFLFVLFCIGIASYFSYWFVTNPDMSISETSTSSNPSLTHDINSQNNIQTLEKEVKTFKATPVSISNDKTFIRVINQNDEVYSIGISSTTKIFSDGKEVPLNNITSQTAITVVASELDDTKQFDYIAQSLEIKNELPTTEELIELSKERRQLMNN